ncbi:hypothetical protein STEG23_009195 [Scotinomys teguina]
MDVWASASMHGLTKTMKNITRHMEKLSKLRWSKARVKAEERLDHILKNRHSTVEDKKQRPEDWCGQSQGHKAGLFPDTWPHPQGPAPWGFVHWQELKIAAKSATAFHLKGSRSQHSAAAERQHKIEAPCGPLEKTQPPLLEKADRCRPVTTVYLQVKRSVTQKQLRGSSEG